MKRFGSTRWNGGLREGKGVVSTESRALENRPYSFFTRYGEKPGTNPEELLGAAHAACLQVVSSNRGRGHGKRCHTSIRFSLAQSCLACSSRSGDAWLSGAAAASSD